MIQALNATAVFHPKERFISFCLYALLVLPVPGIASTATSHSQSNADLQSRLEAALEEHNVAGASVAIWQDGQLSTAAAGVTNVTTGVPITTDTIMHIGSISKVLNTTLIMQLVDEGLVDLDKPLKTYLPDFTLADKKAENKITVAMLLNHTNGIDDGGALGLNDQNPGAQRIIDLVNQTPTMVQVHEPGKDLSYSNIGTVLAGYLAEQLTGKSWYELIRERIYKPLDMHHAIAQPENALLHRASIGHILNSETDKLKRASAPFLSPNYAPAGTTLMMSASDLVIFGRTQINDGMAPNNNRLLSVKSTRLIQEETSRSQDISAPSFGLGWKIYDEGVGHGGGGPGVLSWLYVSPSKDIVAVILTNSDSGMGVINDILEPLFKSRNIQYFDVKEKEIVARAKDKPVDAGSYVGMYEGLGVRIIVKQHAGNLMLSTLYKQNGYKKNSPEVQLKSAGNGYFVSSSESTDATKIYRFINPDNRHVMRHITTFYRMYQRVE